MMPIIDAIAEMILKGDLFSLIIVVSLISGTIVLIRSALKFAVVIFHGYPPENCNALGESGKLSDFFEEDEE